MGRPKPSRSTYSSRCASFPGVAILILFTSCTRAIWHMCWCRLACRILLTHPKMNRASLNDPEAIAQLKLTITSCVLSLRLLTPCRNKGSAIQPNTDGASRRRPLWSCQSNARPISSRAANEFPSPRSTPAVSANAGDPRMRAPLPHAIGPL